MSGTPMHGPEQVDQSGPISSGDAAGATSTAGSPFAELSRYVALPRLSGLALSADGRRLVTTVASLDAARTAWITALWEIDPDGARPSRRLTHGPTGESTPTFAPDGALLFLAKRPDPSRSEQPDPLTPALWSLPPGGGEAKRVIGHPGGVRDVRVAADSGTVLLAAAAMPGATAPDADADRVAARKDAGVSAVLFEDYPVRHWDHDLGPAHTRIFALAPTPPDAGAEPSDPRDVTPELPAVTDIDDFTLSRDGRWVAVAVDVAAPDSSRRQRIDLVDVVTGDCHTVADEDGFDFGHPAFSPDGARLVCTRSGHGSWDEPGDTTLWLVDLGPDTGRDLTPTFPQWPDNAVFAADGNAVLFSCDEAGHHPLFRVDLADDVLTRLTARGAFSDVQVHPDGCTLFAIRARVDAPPQPVRLDDAAADQDPEPLPSPGELGDLPGTLTEISTVAADGASVRSWLVLPRGASPATPAPLLLWIHGGPLMSWNAWSWRWNPWLMAARGYAVLLPDPALSAGYGQDYVRRGWGAWGAAPFTDLMAVTDAAEAREDIDQTRTAAMGGSFGGYMANWVAGHTDRFRAVVTHASLWQLDQFSGTTDSAHYWAREFGDPLHQRERYEDNSPHHAVAEIRSPMLVIHGDKDYRVPIGEALRLWYDLRRHGVESKFLYFPDENHWVGTPGNAAVWYETVLAFLAQHVLGETWVRPDLL